MGAESDSFWHLLSIFYETRSISLFSRGNFNDAIRLKATPLWVRLVSHFVSQKLSFLSWDYETHRISLFLRGGFKNAIRLKVTPLWVTLVSHTSESQSFFFELGSWNSQYKLVFVLCPYALIPNLNTHFHIKESKNVSNSLGMLSTHSGVTFNLISSLKLPRENKLILWVSAS